VKKGSNEDGVAKKMKKERKIVAGRNEKKK